MMTGPGLALFYGGLVRKKNVLGVMMQCVLPDGPDDRRLGAVGLLAGVRRQPNRAGSATATTCS